ncbi:MAG: hypothetical protein HC888_07000 [Candidatus Competibacteraceae bacterium]|nr:hypothetical protein [Candidatus Competibacteraceae bacterium]
MAGPTGTTRMGACCGCLGRLRQRQAWDYHHDDRGRLLNAVYRNPSGTPIYRHGYTYDAGDNLLTREKVAYEDKVVDDFSDNEYTSNPVWTPTLTWTAASGYLQLVDAIGIINTPPDRVNTEALGSHTG